MKEFLSVLGRRLGSGILNKYFIVLVTAGLWIGIFDNYNFISQYKVHAEIEQLEQDRDFYKMEIKKVNYRQERLLNDAEELERYAREMYHMKKRNEDLFLIVEK